MNTSNPNPCFPFDPAGDSGPIESLPINWEEATFDSVIVRLKRDETLEPFLTLSSAATRREELLTLIRNIGLFYIDENKTWRLENCTSIYDFCARQRNNSLAIGRGTVCEGLKSARAMQTISGYNYRDRINSYLENEGRDQGKGRVSDDGARLVFRLVDFVGHISKLGLLQRLIDRNQTEIDWHEFFSDGFQEYQEYVHRRIRPDNQAEFSSFETKPSSSFRPEWQALEPSQETDDNAPIQRLDPFENAFNYKVDEVAVTTDDHEHHHLEPLELDKVSSGSLRRHPIFEESALYHDHAYPQRALEYLNKNVRPQ